MSDLSVIAATLKTMLLDIAKQAAALGTGLKNAAPGDKTSPNNSVQYLLDISESLIKVAESCNEAALNGDNPQH